MAIFDLNYIIENTMNSKLYRVSKSDMNGKIINPSVPDNFMTKNGYEDNTTKRVCFAPTIQKCLMGLSRNLVDQEYFVLVPDGEYNTYKPSVKEVPDSKITGEVWIKEPVKVKCIGKIKVIKDKGSEGKSYSYGDGKSAELYEWEYKWIQKIN